MSLGTHMLRENGIKRVVNLQFQLDTAKYHLAYRLAYSSVDSNARVMLYCLSVQYRSFIKN